MPALVLSAPGTEVELPVVIVGRETLPANSFLRIRGLSPKMALSDGHVIAPGSWAVPLSALGRLRIFIPAGNGGRNTVHIALVAIDGGQVAEALTTLVVAAGATAEATPEKPRSRSGLGGPPASPAREADAARPAPGPPPPPAPAPPLQSPASSPTPAPAPRAAAVAALPPVARAEKPPPAAPTGPVLAPAERVRALDFLARGRNLLAEGNVSSARLFFERSADIGLADAALAMGDTFEAGSLASTGAIGIRPDPVEARRWYERARELGAGEAAARRLERLGAR